LRHPAFPPLTAMIGAYTRVKQIGQGSFGKCFLVKDKKGTQLVMKQVDLAKLCPKGRREAGKEVQVLSALRHPYIISFHESFTQSQTLCIVMDFAEGGDLAGAIDRTRRGRRQFEEGKLLQWMAQAFLALKYTHDRHVLHRDLKPQNMFLTANGTLKIGDFGIAKVMEGTAAVAKTAIGTPYYLAPEMCKERPYAWPADVWAMGVILYELCALRVPFDGANLPQLIANIMRAPVPAIPARYSREVQVLGSELLSRDYKRRPKADQVLQSSVMQGVIRKMLKEKDDRRSRPPSVAK